MLPKILHIEPTDACNAACPQCARETDISFNKDDLHHLTVDQIKSLVSVETIKNLDKMFMCGVYGDPAAGKYTLDIFDYFRTINPTITLGMNTNGGLRSTTWWKKLASILSLSQDYVVWSIDGLSDTNHIYRKNVRWDVVMKNASTFIRSGGNAHWDMLVFSYNEHQLNDAVKLAQEMGFKYFRSKVSRRFDSMPVSFLNPPKSWNEIKVENGPIVCQAEVESSLYISAKGITYPCCWLAATDVNDNLSKFNEIKASWSSDTPHRTCQETCGTTFSGNAFKDQWKTEICLSTI